jgi:hypothetical protein
VRGLRGPGKGVVVAIGCVAAIATAWSSVWPTDVSARRWYNVLYHDTGVHLTFVVTVWVTAVLLGVPIAIKVGRYAGQLADDYWTRHRVAKLIGLAVGVAVAGCVTMALGCRSADWRDVFAPLLVRALPCAALAAIVLERWARLAPIPDVLPPARVAQRSVPAA